MESLDAVSVFRPQRAVSARELSRRMAHILDEIHESGTAVSIVRYGRIVAVLAPCDGERVGPARAWTAPYPPPTPDAIDDPELDDVDRQLLRAILASPTREHHVNDGLPGREFRDGCIATSRLELMHLVERVGNRVRLTKRGLLLASRLAS